MLEVTDYLKLD